MLLTHWVDNYLGFPDGIMAYELVEKMTAHAKRFGIDEMNGEVVSLAKVQDGIRLELANGDSILTRAVIIATGANPKRLNAPGEQELTGKGVSYCATCDGPFYRDQTVAVVGGGDTAVEEALFLTKFARKVYLIHRRDRLRAVALLQEKALSEPKIEPVWNTVVESVNGVNAVESLSLLNKVTGERSELPVNGVFVFVGLAPNTSFLPLEVKRDEQGFILTDEWMKTSVPGILAVGDCRAKPLRQIITAVGDGATAAFAVSHMLTTE
jgi:thioredoxin reductase (NADPH)